MKMIRVSDKSKMLIDEISNNDEYKGMSQTLILETIISDFYARMKVKGLGEDVSPVIRTVIEESNRSVITFLAKAHNMMLERMDQRFDEIMKMEERSDGGQD